MTGTLSAPDSAAAPGRGLHYKWIALPDIFRGSKLDPLAPGNTSYFLWTLMGFMLVVTLRKRNKIAPACRRE